MGCSCNERIADQDWIAYKGSHDTYDVRASPHQQTQPILPSSNFQHWCKHKADMENTPTELLQHIAGFADPSDLLALRTTSRVIERKVFDSFTTAYISSRVCLVLEPARLYNLESIVSSSTLAKHLDSLVLTLGPPSLPPNHASFEHEFVDIPRLSALLKKLKVTGKLRNSGSCHVSLDLRRGYAQTLYASFLKQPSQEKHHGSEFAMRSAYQDVLQAVVLEAEYDVRHIIVNRQQHIEPADPAGIFATRLRSSFRKTEAIELGVGTVLGGHCENDHSNILHSPQPIRIHRAMLQASEHLQLLSLTGAISEANNCCPHSAAPDACNTAYMLGTNPLCNLRALALSDLFVAESVLVKTLASCIGTLKRLYLSNIYNDSSSWRGAFVHIRSLDHALEHLELRDLVARFQEGSQAHYLFDPRFGGRINGPPLPGDAAGQENLCENLSVRGTLAVQDTLIFLAVNEAYYISKTYFPLNDGETVHVESFEFWQQNCRASNHGFGVAELQ